MFIFTMSKQVVVGSLTVLLAVSFTWGNNIRKTTYMWTCNKTTGFCEKTNAPIDYKEAPSDYMSHKICRLTCGKYASLWPKPTITSRLSKDVIQFHPSSVRFESDATDEKYLRHLQKIKHLFLKSIYTQCDGCSMKNENEVIVQVSSHHLTTDLVFGVDESYVLSIQTQNSQILINIVSKTIYGVRNALETLSQLMVTSRISPKQSSEDVMLVTVRNATIVDRPVYLHRGLLIDTARNYLPVATIKRQIDGMAHSKLNVLHWHATDSQSFPLQLSSNPLLSKYGAYSEDSVYTEEDIQELLTYAKYRGVRIVLEIDMPSHAGNGWQWGKKAGLGSLAVCVNKKPWRLYCIQPPCGQLNPVNDNVYVILGQLYSDVIRLFPRAEMFHMGGDEVFLPCWNASADITEYLIASGKGLTTEDFLWLWGQFQQKSMKMYDKEADNSLTDIIVWSSALTEPDIIGKYLNVNRYIIQTWVPSHDRMPEELLNLGYRLIISTKNAWYLDHGFWGSTTYYPWRVVYKNELPSHKGVLGGEVCMWGELVDDSSIDSRIWPRAAAAAERLWSDPSNTAAAAEPRFYQHRNRLVNLGIQAEALTPTWCVQNEGRCI